MSIHYSVSMIGSIKETWDGVITSINIERQPYEAEITARGSCFHIIFGKHMYGNYICIPNWNAGTEIVNTNDVFWNYERLKTYTKLNGVDACSVAYALKKLGELIEME